MTHLPRLFAENVLHCVIDLSQQAAAEQKKAKKKKRKEGLNGIMDENKSIQEDIVEKACALLNSGGGILKMTISVYEGLQSDISGNHLDMFWKTLEQKLTSLVEPSTYNNVFHRLQSGSEEVLLFVNAPQHVCTINYNLYFAGDAGAYEAKFQQVFAMLQKSGNCHHKSSNVDISLKNLRGLPKKFSFEKNCGFHESREIQLKEVLGSETILEKHGQRDRMQKHISAFANTNGGVLLLGIDDSGIVRGVDMNKNKQDKILERIEAMLKDMKFPIFPERKVHWDLEFIKVSDCETTQDLAVVVIKVAGMENFGGVFQKTPKSYELQNGKVQEIEIDRWKEMIKGSELQTDTKGLCRLFTIL